jgi:hypothetical protein
MNVTSFHHTYASKNISDNMIIYEKSTIVKSTYTNDIDVIYGKGIHFIFNYVIKI